MDKHYKIKIGRNAVYVLRKLKQSEICYCVNDYNEGILYLTVFNITEDQLAILENMKGIEELKKEE